jgi:hypothetical protein
MSNSKKQSRPPGPEQAAKFLSPRLRTSLVLIHKGGEELVPSIIDSLPRGSRLALISLQALAPAPGDPAQYVLTAAGRELAAACAVEGLPPQAHRLLTEIEEERARRAAAIDTPSGAGHNRDQVDCGVRW